MTHSSSDGDQTIRPATGIDSYREARTEFFRKAKEAKAAGLVTQQEIDMIYRPGTRKQNYWKRHTYDLEWVIRDRLKERAEKAKADGG